MSSEISNVEVNNNNIVTFESRKTTTVEEQYTLDELRALKVRAEKRLSELKAEVPRQEQIVKKYQEALIMGESQVISTE